MDPFDGWMARWMNGWMNGWMDACMHGVEHATTGPVFFGLLGRLGKCCLLSSRFFEKILVACALDWVALRQLAELMLFCSPSCACKSTQNEVQNV